MKGFATVLAVGSLVLAASAAASDATLKATFLKGVTQIRTSSGAESLHDKLVVTRAKLTADQASTSRGKQGRVLAIQGFAWRIRAVVQLELASKLNDEAAALSADGDLEGAQKKFTQVLVAATKATRFQKTGTALLRASGKAFGVTVRLGKGA